MEKSEEFQKIQSIIDSIQTPIYVADQLLRLERRCINNPDMQIRILSLIASELGIIPYSRSLSQDEVIFVKRFLTVFRLTRKGRNAILVAKKFPRWQEAA